MLAQLRRPLLALLVASLVPIVAAAAPPAPRGSAVPEQCAPEEGRGVFVEHCRFSHAAADPGTRRPSASTAAVVACLREADTAEACRSGT